VSHFELPPAQPEQHPQFVVDRPLGGNATEFVGHPHEFASTKGEKKQKTSAIVDTGFGAGTGFAGIATVSDQFHLYIASRTDIVFETVCDNKYNQMVLTGCTCDT
jgi:hypothetical protein